MKKYLVAAAVIAAVYIGLGRTNGPLPFGNLPGTRTDTTANGFSAQQSGTQVTSKGIVTKILADDTDGSQHQRFILRLASGQTVLVAHNIDLAPRITSLKSGDTVEFNGVFEWNQKGGVIHWTHHDPSGRHEAGWLRHAGQTVQ
jgi:hypothetical protein